MRINTGTTKDRLPKAAIAEKHDVGLFLRLPQRLFDAANRAARKARMSRSQWVRSALEAAVSPRKDG